MLFIATFAGLMPAIDAKANRLHELAEKIGKLTTKDKKELHYIWFDQSEDNNFLVERNSKNETPLDVIKKKMAETGFNDDCATMLKYFKNIGDTSSDNISRAERYTLSIERSGIIDILRKHGI
jgi:hypothetical protein